MLWKVSNSKHGQLKIGVLHFFAYSSYLSPSKFLNVVAIPYPAFPSPWYIMFDICTAFMCFLLRKATHNFSLFPSILTYKSTYISSRIFYIEQILASKLKGKGTPHTESYSAPRPGSYIWFESKFLKFRRMHSYGGYVILNQFVATDFSHQIVPKYGVKFL